LSAIRKLSRNGVLDIEVMERNKHQNTTADYCFLNRPLREERLAPPAYGEVRPYRSPGLSATPRWASFGSGTHLRSRSSQFWIRSRSGSLGFTQLLPNRLRYRPIPIRRAQELT
jgi:hypothetical protein